MIPAQFAGDHPPPPLPASPALERLALENPYPGAVTFLLLGVVAWAALRAKPARRWQALGAGLALAGIAWALATFTITTREQLKSLTRRLVDATATVNIDALGDMLAEDAMLTPGSEYAAMTGGGARLNKAGILRAVEETLGNQWRVKEHSVLESQATIDGTRTARTQARVRVVPEATGFPDASWWMIDWRLDDGEWRVVKIQPATPGREP